MRMDFFIVALGRKQPPSGVSLLKVESKVSTFPVIKAAKADFITIATMKILGFCHLIELSKYKIKGMKAWFHPFSVFYAAGGT